MTRAGRGGSPARRWPPSAPGTATARAGRPPYVPQPTAEQMIPPWWGYSTRELTINDILDGRIPALQASPRIGLDDDGLLGSSRIVFRNDETTSEGGGGIS